MIFGITVSVPVPLFFITMFRKVPRMEVLSKADAGKLNCLRYARPAEARPEARGQVLKFPLKFRFSGLKTPRNVCDFLGDHFAPIESSGNLILNMFILDSYIFSYF